MSVFRSSHTKIIVFTGAYKSGRRGLSLPRKRFSGQICRMPEKYITLHHISGEVSEWLKEPASKTGVRVTVPGVRIPSSPQKCLSAHPERHFLLNRDKKRDKFPSKNRSLSLPFFESQREVNEKIISHSFPGGPAWRRSAYRRRRKPLLQSCAPPGPFSLSGWKK